MRKVINYVLHFVWETVKACGRLTLVILPFALVAAYLKLGVGAGERAVGVFVLLSALLLVVAMEMPWRFGKWLKGGWL